MDTSKLEVTKIKTPISVRIEIGRLIKLDELQQRYRLKDRSAAIMQLLDLAFHVESKIGTTEAWTSEVMEEIKGQIENGQFVDWIAELDHKKFTTLLNILKEEEKYRLRKTREGQQRLTI